MDLTDGQDPGGPSSGRGKTPATGLRRSGRIITQTKKLQEELASASKEQDNTKAPNVKGASTKDKAKNTANNKSDGSAPLNKQAPPKPQAKPSTPQPQGTASTSKNNKNNKKKNPRTKMASDGLDSESGSPDGGKEVNAPSPPSPSPFYDPRKAGRAHDGAEYALPHPGAQASSTRGHRVPRGVSYDPDAMDITEDAPEQAANMNAAYMANPQVHGGGYAHAEAGGPQVPLPQSPLPQASFFDHPLFAPRPQAPRPKSPPPVLYDYQVDYVAKALDASKRLKDTIETLRQQNPAFRHAPSVANPPQPFGPVPPPGMTMNQAPMVGSGPGPFAQASAQASRKKPETLDDIRRNMAKLLDDGPISDDDFLRQHYQDPGANKRLKKALSPLKGIFAASPSTYKGQPTPPIAPHFMAHRGESSAHANGKAPGRASAAFKKNKEKPAAEKKKITPEEEAAAKAVKDFDKANRDYDDAFERNLRAMFD